MMPKLRLHKRDIEILNALICGKKIPMAAKFVDLMGLQSFGLLEVNYKNAGDGAIVEILVTPAGRTAHKETI